MVIIFGLGNPGKEYEKTKHNIGFLIVDEIAKKFDFKFKKNANLFSEAAEGKINQNKIILIKPTAFMNQTGQAVTAGLKYYRANAKEMLVIHDDADLPLGEIRFKESGSSAGHRGVQSIIDSLSAHEFKRLRFGIGRPINQNIPLEEWVLAPWPKKEFTDVVLPLILSSADKIIAKIE